MSIVHPGDDGPDRLVDRASACFRLGVSPSTLDRLRRSGELPAYRIAGRVLRYRLSDIDALITKSRHEVAP